MLRKIKQSFSIFVLIFLFFVGCAGYQKIKTEDAFTQIAPAAPLPQYLYQKQEKNLILRIENVADQANSYKNYVELYVNDYLIEPDEEVTNIKRNYTYRLRLQPGIYKIFAKYYASTGWDVKSYKILTKEKVMILPDKKTLLTIRLKKNSWGGLTENPAFFKIEYEALKK